MRPNRIQLRRLCRFVWFWAPTLVFTYSTGNIMCVFRFRITFDWLVIPTLSQVERWACQTLSVMCHIYMPIWIQTEMDRSPSRENEESFPFSKLHGNKFELRKWVKVDSKWWLLRAFTNFRSIPNDHCFSQFTSHWSIFMVNHD